MKFLHTRPFLATSLLFCAATLIGCGAADDDSVPISGNVTWDGAPLPSGTITFLPSDGVGPSAGAQITEGKYETRAVPGPKSVTIVAQREKAGGNAAAGAHGGPPTEQYLPPKYNSSTELTADVPAEGSDKIDFTLTAK